MSHPQPSSGHGRYALSFLERNPSLSNSLFADCEHDLDQVSTVIEPILHAHRRCQSARFYIQGITTGRTTFLATNLPNIQDFHATTIASTWLIGRSVQCAITVQNLSISRCHAVIGYCQGKGFYITDVGSSNGTWVNRRRLNVSERCPLQDGDLIQLGSLVVEFFAVDREEEASPPTAEATHY